MRPPGIMDASYANRVIKEAVRLAQDIYRNHFHQSVVGREREAQVELKSRLLIDHSYVFDEVPTAKSGRCDLVVNGFVVVELKNQKAKVTHSTQLLQYMRNVGCNYGVIINFPADHRKQSVQARSYTLKHRYDLEPEVDDVVL